MFVCVVLMCNYDLSCRTREDTVRCIVSSLTDDSNKELAEELIKAEPVTMDESYCSEQEDEDHQEWQPDPIDADPGKMGRGFVFQFEQGKEKKMLLKKLEY